MFCLQTDLASLKALLRRARESADGDEPLWAVMKPTGLAWLPVVSYLIRQGMMVCLVNTQHVADLHKFYKKHAKSDGMVPGSEQSSDAEKRGLRMTCAGPDPVKKYSYIQMINKGNHHCQAVCACATHLLNRVRAVS